MSEFIEVVERYPIPDIPTVDLPEEDGVPLETNRHRIQMNLLIDLIKYLWRNRQDFFVGGNMFVYYSLQQVSNRSYKGPDVFVVKNVDGRRPRRKWVVWQEDGRYPDVIVELLSPSTMGEDLGNKKDLYAHTFHTPDYFCYDPETHRLMGWRLSGTEYTPLTSNQHGWLWSEELGAWLGLWEGVYQQERATWLRLYDTIGQLIPAEAEAERQRAEAAETRAEAAETRAEAERQRAEAERQRAEAAEAELLRLREELARLKNP